MSAAAQRVLVDESLQHDGGGDVVKRRIKIQGEVEVYRTARAKAQPHVGAGGPATTNRPWHQRLSHDQRGSNSSGTVSIAALGRGTPSCSANHTAPKPGVIGRSRRRPSGAPPPYANATTSRS